MQLRNYVTYIRGRSHVRREWNAVLFLLAILELQPSTTNPTSSFLELYRIPLIFQVTRVSILSVENNKR